MPPGGIQLLTLSLCFLICLVAAISYWTYTRYDR